MPDWASTTRCSILSPTFPPSARVWPPPWPLCYGAQGQASDIEIEAREIQKIKKELYEIIAYHTGKDYEQVWKDSDRDYWMTAAEAKEYGMIDQVLGRDQKK